MQIDQISEGKPSYFFGLFSKEEGSWRWFRQKFFDNLSFIVQTVEDHVHFPKKRTTGTGDALIATKNQFSSTQIQLLTDVSISSIGYWKSNLYALDLLAHIYQLGL
ncbi:hypothetical protein BLNAU_23299 [Blattamonas nauphoetae]|uniref:Uncharacterized protein n=1 Tax=Blattamonas nauphoetae TaxID=2049346 RepID=A0ABQ9WPN9_9EUKA|nr:hypothetical protein BLNAU_23804 [Blattamonas nauphoetae]KAK2941794.1 hypothetical protein BLNAU_23299 [Blattamonas nauphoetae]